MRLDHLEMCSSVIAERVIRHLLGAAQGGELETKVCGRMLDQNTSSNTVAATGRWLEFSSTPGQRRELR